jgi:GT2 family glycosyltransferase
MQPASPPRASHTTPRIAVVVLSYQGRELLRRFLPSLLQHNRPDAQVWVVDNASTDGTWDMLAAEFPAVQRHRLTQNRGFTNGYVQSLPQVQAATQAEYYVLINSDVEVTAGWLDPLVQLMDANPAIAVVQPKILAERQRTHFEYSGAAGGYIDRWGYPFCRGRLFETAEEDRGQYNDARPVFWGSGACMAVRAAAYHQSGGLDNDFFAHMEEIDLCWRLINQGMQVWVQPQSVVYHVGGHVITYGSYEKLYHNFRNNLVMMLKNERSRWLILKILFRLVLDGVAGLRFLAAGHWAGFKAVLWGHFAFYARIPATLKKRAALRRLDKPASNAGRYSGGIVWQYFVRGRRRFSDFLS